LSEFIDSRPQELCLMCGKCCRCVTTVHSYDELLELSKNEDDEGAKDFLALFEPYNTVEDARNVHPDVVDNIFKQMQNDGKSTDDVNFYKCKYLLDNNECGIYDKRMTLCKRFPATPWAIVPPGCGFEAFLLQKRELIMQNVINQKECMKNLEKMLQNADKFENADSSEKCKNAINKIKKTIEFYSKYGAENW